MEKKPRILMLDLYNLLHRARGGFKLGPAPVCYNFFRSLRSLVEQMDPSRIIAVSEGEPKERISLLPEYKANREIPADDTERLEEMRRFHEQKDVCIGLLRNFFPISVVRHPDYEADDLIATLIDRGTSAVETVLVSTDSDFIQLLQRHAHVRLWHPIRKEWIVAPPYPYTTWKALRGDPTDNIPAVLEGSQEKMDAEADQLASDPELLSQFISDPDVIERFCRNDVLVTLKQIPEEEFSTMESSSPRRDWDAVKAVFAGYGFGSIVGDKPWSKFVGTFDPLFGE